MLSWLRLQLHFGAVRTHVSIPADIIRTGLFFLFLLLYERLLFYNDFLYFFSFLAGSVGQPRLWRRSFTVQQELDLSRDVLEGVDLGWDYLLTGHNINPPHPHFPQLYRVHIPSFSEQFSRRLEQPHRHQPFQPPILSYRKLHLPQLDIFRNHVLANLHLRGALVGSNWRTLIEPKVKQEHQLVQVAERTPSDTF